MVGHGVGAVVVGVGVTRVWALVGSFVSLPMVSPNGMTQSRATFILLFAAFLAAWLAPAPTPIVLLSSATCATHDTGLVVW